MNALGDRQFNMNLRLAGQRVRQRLAALSQQFILERLECGDAELARLRWRGVLLAETADQAVHRVHVTLFGQRDVDEGDVAPLGGKGLIHVGRISVSCRVV